MDPYARTKTDHEPPSPFGGAQGAAHRFAQDLKKARYEVEGEIDRGGMGRVLIARETGLRRRIAMKLLHEEEQTDSRKARLIREARITGILEHPSIVPVHDIGENEQGEIFFTMKKVEGLTLAQVIEKLRPEKDGITNEEKDQRADIRKRFGKLASRLEIIEKMCDAIAFSHAHPLRVIHRDLKPQNIMVGRFGEVLVMDWGLAKVLGKTKTAEQFQKHENDQPEDSEAGKGPFGQFTHAEQSQAGNFMGSWHYAPPEQIEGKLEEIDEKSDVYALGGVLYHLLTLEPPLPVAEMGEGKLDKSKPADLSPEEQVAAQALAKKVFLQLISDCQTAPLIRHKSTKITMETVPNALRPIILGALEPEASKRIQSVAEFKEAITLHRSGFAHAFEDAGPWKHFTYFVGRHKAVSITTAIALLIVSALSAVFTRNVTQERNRANEQAIIAAAEAKRATTANEGLKTQTTLANANAKIALEAQGQAVRAATERGKEAERAKKALQKAVAAQVETHWNLAIQSFAQRKPSFAVANLTKVLRLDPGHQLAGRMLAGILSVTPFPRWRCPPFRVEQHFSINQEVEEIQLTPDGARALVQCYLGDYFLIDTKTGKTLWAWSRDSNDTDDYQQPAFSKDGQYVLEVVVRVERSKVRSVTLRSAVKTSDGQAVTDPSAIASSRQGELQSIAQSFGKHQKLPEALGVRRTAKGLEIAGLLEDRFNIPTIEKIQGSWLSPDKQWFCFNGLAPEPNDMFTNGRLYRLDLDNCQAMWSRAERINSAFFGSASQIMAMDFEGDARLGSAKVFRLWADGVPGLHSVTPLELPVLGELQWVTIGSTSNVLAASSRGGWISIFDLPPDITRNEPKADTISPGQLIVRLGGFKTADDVLSREADFKLVDDVLKDFDTINDFWKSIDPIVASDALHQTALLVWKGEIAFGRKGSGTVARWPMPPGGTGGRLEAALVCPGPRIIVLIGDLLSSFEPDRLKPVSSRTIDLVGDLSFLEDGRILVTSVLGFSILDASTLAELSRCRLDFESEIPAFMASSPPAGELAPEESLLDIAEQVAGWRVTDKGEYEIAAFTKTADNRGVPIPIASLEDRFAEWLISGSLQGELNPILQSIAIPNASQPGAKPR